MNLQLTSVITREKCVLCNGILENSVNIPKVPINIRLLDSLTEPEENYYFSDFVVGKCLECSLPQLTSLIPLDVLYKNNPHMTQGKMFVEMFKQFSSFIYKHARSNNMTTFFEIGDPSCKTMNACLETGMKIDNWVIMDPNLNDIENLPSCCHRIKEWFDPASPPSGIKSDCIITSHVFEHFYDPSLALQAFGRMTDNLLFCLPNMKSLAIGNRLPPIGMMFQHTFYADENVLRDMFQRNGWEIQDFEFFLDNSIFLWAKKTTPSYNVKKPIENNIILSNLNQVVNRVDKFIIQVHHLNIADDEEVYIFGSHFGTQILVSKGIAKAQKILGILDNDIRKNEKYLYGTGLTIYTPKNVMADNKKIIILMFPYQSYDKEIMEGLELESKKYCNMRITYVVPT